MAYSVNTGRKTFEIEVEDIENGVIKLSFNPADTNIVVRYNDFSKELEKKIDDLPVKEITLDKDGNPDLDKMPEVAERITDITNLICESYDKIFGEGTSKELFKYCNPMTINNGKPFAVAIGEVIAKIIKDNTKKEQPKYEKYLRKYAR